MDQGPQSAARPYGRAQAGLVHGGAVRPRCQDAGTQLPLAGFRAAFQRAAVLQPLVLPFRYAHHTRADASDERLQHALPELPRSAKDAGRGVRRAFSGHRRADGAYPERQRYREAGTTPCRAAHRYGGGRGPRGPLLRTLRHAAGRQRRPPARCRTDAHRRQTTHALHALRSGCDAADHGHRRSLRTALDGALRLPPLVRGSRGASAAVQPHLQPDDLSGQPRPDPRTAGSDGTQHELPVALLTLQCAQQGVDRPLPQ